MRILALGDRDPVHLTHRELDAAFALMPDGVECSWTATDSREAHDLGSVDGVWLLPGTPYRDDESAFAAIEHCRTSATPFLGTCGGFQYACVALARTLAGIARAAHAETDPAAEELVVVPLACALYGERRLVEPKADTRLATICGIEPFVGFHWCGFGLDPVAQHRLQSAGRGAQRVGPGRRGRGDRASRPSVLYRYGVPATGRRERSESLHPLIAALLDAARQPGPPLDKVLVSPE